MRWFPILLLLIGSVCAHAGVSKYNCDEKAIAADFLQRCKIDFLNEYEKSAHKQYQPKIEKACKCFASKLNPSSVGPWVNKTCKLNEGAAVSVVRMARWDMPKECDFSWFF